MENSEPLLLPVDFNGDELEFEMRLLPGYAHRVQVVVSGTKVVFETDNDDCYRALIDPERLAKSTIQPSLLEAIAGQLALLFNR